jgi:hypothetical protein
MNPPIERSVVCTEQDRWLLGRLNTCEIVDTVPNDAAVHWEADGKTYCIRTSTVDVDESVWRRGDAKSNLYHSAGTSAAVWNIGGFFIKVKAWQEGMQLESDTIKFVNSISQNSTSRIPTPEVIHCWVDAQWNRSFLVLKALEGDTLYEAWGSLSDSQRTDIARTVAGFCDTLASSTSERLETAHGKAVQEPFLTPLALASDPSWKPRTFGPYSATQLQSMFSKDLVLTGHIDLFSFYHADLGPSNILVSKDGTIAGVLDWESAAYYPKFWLGTKPLISAGFHVSGPKKKAWACLLAESLKSKGLSPDMECFHAWQSAVRN